MAVEVFARELRRGRPRHTWLLSNWAKTTGVGARAVEVIRPVAEIRTRERVCSHKSCPNEAERKRRSSQLTSLSPTISFEFFIEKEKTRQEKENGMEKKGKAGVGSGPVEVNYHSALK